MTQLTILLLSGWAGSGKDAAAALLVEEMGYHRVAFADSLKRICSKKFELPLSHFYEGKDRHIDHRIDAYPAARTPRDLMLAYARDARAVYDTIFAQAAAKEIADIVRAGGKHIVISDWRWPVEERVLRDAFPSARIIRGRIVRACVTQMEDPSEHSLDDADMDLIIQNDGTISDLRASLHVCLRARTGILIHPSS